MALLVHTRSIFTDNCYICIAGPGGGTPLKPVGLVYIGVATCKKAEAFRFIFSGDRREVREQTVQKALQIAIDKLC